MVAASAPVTDFTGHVIAALNISAPKARVAPGRLNTLGEFVAHAAHTLSAHLGSLHRSHSRRIGEPSN